jgi:phosphate transport system permease protein
MGEVVVGSPHYATLFFLGGMLFLITFVINTLAGLLVERMRRKLGTA